MQIHWPLVISTVCQRAGLGLFVCAWIANLFGAGLSLNVVALISLAFLVVGGCASVFHLQRPQRFFNAFSNLKSHLTQEGLITPFLGIALLLVGLGIGGCAMEVIAMLLCLAFLVCTGLAYQMKSRPAWNTSYVLVLFLLTAAEAGFVGAAAPTASQAAPALAIVAVVAIVVATAAQLGYIARMKGVGYKVAYDAWTQPYKPVALTWIICAVLAALFMVAAALGCAAVAMALLAEICILVSIAAWTVLFFKGAHKVKMFPMYDQDLNLDM